MITKPIFLCGYTSSGKTTIGKELAKQLHVPFYDTDKLITVKTGHTPQEIFAEKGDAYFRDTEHEIAKEVAFYPPPPALFPQEAACLPSPATAIFFQKPVLLFT